MRKIAAAKWIGVGEGRRHQVESGQGVGRPIAKEVERRQANGAAAIGGIALVVFLFFFGFRLVRFVGTPDFTLEEPRDGVEFIDPIIFVRGRAEKESSLTVNGRELKIDEFGRFDEQIELASGVHTLEFIVKNRFGKITKEIRNIIIK